jgi:hypothetical protein
MRGHSSRRSCRPSGISAQARVWQIAHGTSRFARDGSPAQQFFPFRPSGIHRQKLRPGDDVCCVFGRCKRHLFTMAKVVIASAPSCPRSIQAAPVTITSKCRLPTAGAHHPALFPRRARQPARWLIPPRSSDANNRSPGRPRSAFRFCARHAVTKGEGGVSFCRLERRGLRGPPPRRTFSNRFSSCRLRLAVADKSTSMWARNGV